MTSRRTPLHFLISLALFLGVASALEAQTVQLRANDNDERWGDLASPTSQGKVLWFERDGTTNEDDVYLFDGATVHLIQAQGDLTNVDAPVFALGTGATPGSVIAAWRRDTDFAWISVDGGTPVLVSATNPSDPAEPLNPEGAGIADGCVFLVLQDQTGPVNRKHVFRVDPATGSATILTDPAIFPITGNATGASRVNTSGCRAAWRFFDGTGATPSHSVLHFYDGAGVSVVDSGEIDRPHMSQGRVVYAKKVAGVSQVFVYDSTVASPAPVQLTSYTDPTRTNSHAKTDGRHVAWLRQTTENLERHIVLNGGLQLTTIATKPADGGPSIDFPIQLQRGQMVWKDAAGALRYLTKTGIATVPIAPALSVVNPWLADGYIAFTGTNSDGGADAEPFRFTGTAPVDGPQPSPPLLVRVSHGNGKVTVAWDRILGATAYNLYYAQEPGVTRENYLSLLGGTRVAGVTPPLTVTGLANGTTYYFVVTAVEAGVEGGTSGEASATPRAPFCIKPGGGSGCASTIGAALTNAIPGDTIRVAAGSYTEYVTIDKTITLEGGWNAAFTARDPAANPTTIRPPDGSFSVVQIRGQAADPAAVAPTLDGFTITGGGGGNHGGGLRVWHSNALIRNNAIRSNVGFLLGGGVWAVGGAPRFENNRVEDNVCDGQGQDAYGGGISLAGTQATLAGNVIGFNRIVNGQFGHGGGIAAMGGGPVTLIDNQIVSNTIPHTPTLMGIGGGVYIQAVAAPTLSGNLIQGNAVFAKGYLQDGRGGGVDIESATAATMTANVIEGNVVNGVDSQGDDGSPTSRGGGVYLDASSVTLSNNTISANRITARFFGQGGGVYMRDTRAVLSSNTIRDNTANAGLPGCLGGDGGGLSTLDGTLTMRGDQIVNNVAGDRCFTKYGHGLLTNLTPATLDRLRVQGNGVCDPPCGGDGYGGGLALRGPFTLTNSLVTGNGVEGLVQEAGTVGHVVNSSFVGNPGSAIYCTGCGYAGGSGSLRISNTIIAGHYIGVFSFGPQVTADHNLFWNNTSNANFTLDGTNLVADPLLDANLAPQGGSPAIDAGRNDAVPSGITADLRGSRRFVDDSEKTDTGTGTPPIVDIGAYEFMPVGDLIFKDGFESGG